MVPSNGSGRIKYSYKVVNIHFSDNEAAQAVLDQLGEEGWLLWQVVGHNCVFAQENVL